MSNRILVFFEKEFNNAEEGDVLNDKEKVFTSGFFGKPQNDK